MVKYGKSGCKERSVNGMTLAMEPMVNDELIELLLMTGCEVV